MDSQEQNLTPNRENGGVAESDNVDRIRNILFGSQMRDYDDRFQKLEERLGRHAAEVRSELQEKLQALEALIKGEAESVCNRLNAEQSERRQAIENLAQEMSDTVRGLESKITNLENKAAQDIGQLREQLLEQTKALSAELNSKHDEMKDRFEREARRIRDAMTGREALAEVLSELASRLKNESAGPAAS
jgi:uncharacterized phage infection (PIP) family protein YhgE